MKLLEIAAKNIKTKLEYHDEFNEKIWDIEEYPPTLHHEISEKLKNITNDFMVKAKIKKSTVKDVVLTGSICNYNWSKLSDIDLHIVLDYDKVCPECSDYFDIQSCMDSKKSVWNTNHEVTIKGFNVEVYVESSDTTKSSNSGIYSLLNSEWIRLPEKEDENPYNDAIIKKIAKKYMDKIDKMSKDKNLKIEELNKVKTKLKKQREQSVNKGGEFSLYNLVYKTLRNNGYIEKLYNLENEIENKELSLK